MLALSGTSALACEPKLELGVWSCPWSVGLGDGGASGADDNGNDVARPSPSDPVAIPWSTSFESGFCDYPRSAGFCYGDEEAEFSIVTAPVRTGKYAAAFRVRGDGGGQSRQARCVRQGVFPIEASYSAWYFIPEFATNRGVWNLLHFQGGSGPGPTNLPGLWDVSVASDGTGELRLFFLNFLPSPTPIAEGFPPIPIAKWFKIEVYFRRAADATGEFAVYQDDELVVQLTDLVTDDTTWGQWYVGNLADSLMPPDSTVYVDDVMIRARR
jgi:hypothetical protein